MKKHITTIIGSIFFLAGLLVFLYPTISDTWNKYRNSQIEVSYVRQVKKTDSKELRRMRKEATDYNKYHNTNTITDMMSEEDTEDEDYLALLNPCNDGVMGTLNIPKINITLAIYHGIGDQALESGCGHLPGTSLPIGGSSSHCALAAHRGLKDARLFTDLDQMEVGDKFYVTVLDQIHVYTIDQIETVLPSESQNLQIVPEKDYITLITCTPYGVNSHRLLVRGVRTPEDEGANAEQTLQNLNNTDTTQSTFRTTYGPWIIGAGGIGLFIIFILLLKKGKKNEDEDDEDDWDDEN